MEWLAELLLSLLWDAFKTLVLQWLLSKLQEWWRDFSTNRQMSFA